MRAHFTRVLGGVAAAGGPDRIKPGRRRHRWHGDRTRLRGDGAAGDSAGPSSRSRPASCPRPGASCWAALLQA